VLEGFDELQAQIHLMVGFVGGGGGGGGKKTSFF